MLVRGVFKIQQCAGDRVVHRSPRTEGAHRPAIRKQARVLDLRGCLHNSLTSVFWPSGVHSAQPKPPCPPKGSPFSWGTVGVGVGLGAPHRGVAAVEFDQGVVGSPFDDLAASGTMMRSAWQLEPRRWVMRMTVRPC
jgi:hypothetical protein